MYLVLPGPVPKWSSRNSLHLLLLRFFLCILLLFLSCVCRCRKTKQMKTNPDSNCTEIFPPKRGVAFGTTDCIGLVARLGRIACFLSFAQLPKTKMIGTHVFFSDGTGQPKQIRFVFTAQGRRRFVLTTKRLVHAQRPNGFRWNEQSDASQTTKPHQSGQHQDLGALTSTHVLDGVVGQSRWSIQPA